MIRDYQMHGLVRNEVTEYEIRRENEAPVEGQIPSGRAVAPLRALTHHVDGAGSCLMRAVTKGR